MTRNIPAYLKLHVENVPASPASSAPACLRACCEAFEHATGWQLDYHTLPGRADEAWSMPIPSGDGLNSGRLTLTRSITDKVAEAGAPLELVEARPLAIAIGGMLGEINRLRHALWQREAELAAGVPVSSRPDEKEHLAERLEGVLKGGAEAVGCQAAALYLLDESTSALKLRAAWGLPQERLLEPARPLRGAIAELEALVGHAVVLEDTQLLPHWRCPEDYPSAVCVPVSSSTLPLGTLWVFSDCKRDFTSEQTNLIEIIAGRLAADLEREVLLTAGVDSRLRDKQFDTAARWQQDRLPSFQPLVDDLEFAGWTLQAEGVGGDFYDWSVLPDGRLAVAVGDAQGSPLEAGLSAAAVQASLKSHSLYRHDSAQLLGRLNETLWTGSTGDQFASLFYGLIQPDNGAIEFSLAGNAALLVVGRECREVLTTDSPPLGTAPETEYQIASQTLHPGDILVVLSEGARNAVDEAGLRIGDAAITGMVQRHREESAQDLVARLRMLLERSGPDRVTADMTVLVVKRRR